MAETREERAAASEPAAASWERVITVEVQRWRSGLFCAYSPDIRGMFAHGRSIGEALGRVETAVRDLAEAGCKQSQTVLARANTPTGSNSEPSASEASAK